MHLTQRFPTLALLSLTASLGGCYVQSGPPATAYYPADEVVVSPPPEPPPPEADPAPPVALADNQEWIRGHYRWDGHRYEWQRAHSERRPRPNAHYHPGHWEQRGRGRAYVPGHWG